MKGKQLAVSLGVLAAAMILLYGTSAACRSYGADKQEKNQQEVLQALLPGSDTFTEEVYEGEDMGIVRVFQGNTGYVVETVVDGYVDEMTLLVGVENGGSVTGLTIRDMAETWGLGRRAMTDQVFLTQFLDGTGNAEVGTNVDALTGATVSSKAVAKAVNLAVAYVTGADVASSATEWGG